MPKKSDCNYGTFKYVIAYFALIAIVMTEFLYRDKLYDKSMNFIRKAQEHLKGAQMTSWRQFSWSGVPTMPAVILLMSLDYRLRTR